MKIWEGWVGGWGGGGWLGSLSSIHNQLEESSIGRGRGRGGGGYVERREDAEEGGIGNLHPGRLCKVTVLVLETWFDVF